MASNVFTEAKKYQKKHPRTSWQDCIKAVSGKAKNKPAKKVSGTAKKVVKKTVVRKKTVVKKLAGIGADAITEYVNIQRKIDAQENAVGSLRNKLTGATSAEKKAIRQELAKRKSYIGQMKKNRTGIKKFL